MCSNDRKPRFAQLFETRRSNTCLNICPSGHYRDAMATEDSPAGRAGSRSRGKARSKVSELPDGPPDATGLTPRQQRVLAHIKEAIEKRGYPPSMREIGEAVGLTSSSSVAHQLRVLEEKGFLKRDPNRPRALEVFLPEVMAARRSLGAAEETQYDETDIGDTVTPGSSMSTSSARGRLGSRRR